jgi:hypothetical protein
VTITEGTNRLVRVTAEGILKGYREITGTAAGGRRIPKLWDGKAAHRIARIIAES